MKLCLRCNQYFNDTLDMCPKDQAPLEEVGKDPIIGALIDDRYVIDSVIGKGSSGIVYKASRLMMGGDVAVKVIHSYLGADSASLDRLLRELKAAEALRHAHMVTVWDSGTTDDGQPYLVMDYCEGITLSQVITQKGALPPKRVLNVLKQVTEALAHAHEQGFIHRDMKPENIVLEESELRGDYVKVLDFGIADTVNDSAQRAKFNKPKTVAGSPAYMSPEQCQGFELDYRSDLYSLAVIVFEMFTGRRPFLAHDLMKLMYMTVTEPPPKMGQVRKDLSFPDKVEAVIAKALSKLPDDRQSTIREFWKELEQACEGLDFGKSDRVKLAPPREQQNVADLEIPSTERLMGGDDKPKSTPNFGAGPEDMPELYVEKTAPPPPPAPKAKTNYGGNFEAGPEDMPELYMEEDPPKAPVEPAKPPSPPAARGPGVASLVNKQQSAEKPPGKPGPSSSGNVKPLTPAPSGAKSLEPSPSKPDEPQAPPPAGPRPDTGGSAAPKPPGPPKPPPPGTPGAGGPRPGGGPPPSPTAVPPLPTKAPPTDSNNGPSAVEKELSEIYANFPDKTMNRLSALVKRPTSSMANPIAEAQPAVKPAAEPVPERPPSVYSYVPPKDDKPAEPESNNNQSPTAPKPAGGPATPGGPAKPGGPNPAGPAGQKPGGPGPQGPGGQKPGGPNPLGPGGLKPGGPIGQKPGGPTGQKPGGPGPQGPGGQKQGGPGPQGPGGQKPGGPGPSGLKPGGPGPQGPGGQKPGGPGGPTGQKPGGPGGPAGQKPGGPAGPAGQKPGGPGPSGQKPGGPGPQGPGGQKPGGPGPAGPGGQKAGPSGQKPGGPQGPGGQKTGPTQAKPGAAQGPGGTKPEPQKTSGSPDSARPGAPQGSKPAPGAPSKPDDGTEPNKSGDETKSGPETKSNYELTPALARAGATWVDSSAEWTVLDGESLDGNALDESKHPSQRRISNVDWEQEIEALKTGSVAPIVIEPGPGGETLNPTPNPWPPGVVPGGPNQMPPQGMPGYPPMQQNWPPGMIPGQPMMPGYDQSMSYPPGMIPPQQMMPGFDQSMSYPPGMMHPYMQPPGYPPGYPLPPNQDVSGAYPLMPQGYPPMPPHDTSGTYSVPGYMPQGPGYPYGPPGMMPPGMPGMQPGMQQGMPPGMVPPGMPPGMVPQGMPPGMVPQGMPPGMVPQGMPPGMVPQGTPPQGMPPFMNPATPDAPSSPPGLGSSLLDDLKSEFGETPQGESIDDLFEDTPGDAPETKSAELPVVELKSEVKEPKEEIAKDEEKESPALRDDLAVPLDKFEKFEDNDESKKQKELAAKSEAEAAELGDSLLALMESTEKDRSGALSLEKPGTKEPAKKEESPKSTGSRALGSLLGALTAADEDFAEPAEKEEKAAGGNAFADAVASSASVPSLSQKSKKSGSAFGQLLAAVKEDDEEEPPTSPSDDDESESAGGGGLPKQAISDALDDLLGPDDSSASVTPAAAMKNPFERGDDLLGDGDSIVKPTDSSTAAARLVSAISDSGVSEEKTPEPRFGATGTNPSTSTSDALSRLLEAASKAPSKASESTTGGAAMTEIDKMAARVNKPPAKVSRKLASAKEAEFSNQPPEPQPFGGFGGGGGGGGFGGGAGNFGGNQASTFGGASDMRSSGIQSTGTNSSYSQDAVNARIAELNKKLEQQSIGRKDVELPQAPPPDPSVIGDSPNRRDVVNRIMEEAGKRHQFGADYDPEPAPASKPSNSGSNFNPNDLEKVSNSRLSTMADQEQRRKKSRGRAATMPRVPVVPIVVGVAVVGLCVAGYFMQEQIVKAFEGIMASMPGQSTNKKDDETLARVNDLVAKGKLNDARKILEQEEEARGLPPEWSDKLDTIYISIAKYKKNAGQTPEAIKTLEIIPSESAHYQEAQKLIKQYKGPKKAPGKRKRR